MDAEKPIGRKPHDHAPPSWVDVEKSDYFITICCQLRGTNQLCLPLVGQALLDSARFYHARRKWFLTLFLLMPDHVHMIFNFGHHDDMAKTIGAWKRFASVQHGITWQKDFFDHRLRGDESWEKADYILHNPVRAGLTSEAAAWPYVFRSDEYSGRERV